jgi:hypothetical protein
MSTLQPPTFRFPFALRDQPHEVQQAHIFAFNAVLDLQRAIGSLKGQINNITTTASTTSTTTEISVGGGSSGTSFPGLGGVNDQTGNTAYTVSAGDNGVLLILNDASPVAVTLNSGLAPPYFSFITNFGAGTVTLTPTAGLINGNASLALLQHQSVYVVFNGTNWKTTDLLPVVNFIDNETPTPAVDGVTTVFTLAHTPNPSTSAKGYLEGLRLNPGVGNDFTISGATITMAVAPPAGQPFLWDYRY